jgi:hypothetical protein
VVGYPHGVCDGNHGGWHQLNLSRRIHGDFVPARSRIHRWRSAGAQCGQVGSRAGAGILARKLVSTSQERSGALCPPRNGERRYRRPVCGFPISFSCERRRAAGRPDRPSGAHRRDSFSRTTPMPTLQERAADYRQMGVQAVWIIDPKTRTGRYLRRRCRGQRPSGLTVPGTPIFVDLDWLFARLDAVSAVPTRCQSRTAARASRGRTNMSAPSRKSTSTKRTMVGVLGFSGAKPVKSAPGHAGRDEEEDAFVQDGVEDERRDEDEAALHAVQGMGGLGSIEAKDGHEVDQVQPCSGVGERGPEGVGGLGLLRADGASSGEVDTRTDAAAVKQAEERPGERDGSRACRDSRPCCTSGRRLRGRGGRRADRPSGRAGGRRRSGRTRGS